MHKKNITKRGHFIPEVYSRNFCIDDTETGFLYQKNNAQKPPVIVNIRNFGLKNYYYAFEKHDGTRDTQTLETMFGVVESEWPNLVELFRDKRKPFREDIDNLCTFLATMRVRVPNFRMQLEQNRAEMVKTKAMVMGKYDKKLNEDFNLRVATAREKGDLESVQNLIKAKKQLDAGELKIAIDPQTSITAIQYIEVLRLEFLKLNWGIFKNNFDQDFITTDNPVVWYDRAHKPFTPYFGGLSAKNLEVILPLTKKLILVGNRHFKSKFAYGNIKKKSFVKECNRNLVISAENLIFSSQNNLIDLVYKYKDVVPRSNYIRLPDRKGLTTIWHYSLGEPHKLPKWTKEA